MCSNIHKFEKNASKVKNQYIVFTIKKCEVIYSKPKNFVFLEICVGFKKLFL